MDGLTNIISKINSDAQNECELIINSAKQKAKDIISEANTNASEEKEKILLNAKKKAEIINSKALSGSELEYKRILLAEKCRIIDEVLKESVDYICNLDEQSYFELLKKLALTNALCGEGVVFFNKRDFERLPLGYFDALNSLMDKGKTLRLSESTVACSAGFVIEYDDMRVDCTIESLISDKADEIRDELSKILF